MKKKLIAGIKLMKYSLFIPAIVGVCLSLNAQNTKKTPQKQVKKTVPKVVKPEPVEIPDTLSTTIVFDNLVHDFGTIKESGGKVTATFAFENKGISPLVITEVLASCGCTTPEWTKEPVAPGGKGYINATFDPTRRIKPFDKRITIHSNARPAVLSLQLKGIVEK